MVIGKPPALRYPRTYVRRSIESQIADFQKLISKKLDAEPLLNNLDLFADIPQRPEDKAELDNWFVVPKWRAIAGSLPQATIFMARAVEVDPKTFLEGYPLGKLEQSERTWEALKVFDECQSGDFWVIPAQLGFFYRGESPAGSIEKMPLVEFGFDLYLTLAALVSHKGRLNGGEDQLGINCPGNKHLNGRGEPRVPCINSSLGRVRCLLNRTAEPNPRYGSATGANFLRAF